MSEDDAPNCARRCWSCNTWKNMRSDVYYCHDCFDSIIREKQTEESHILSRLRSCEDLLEIVDYYGSLVDLWGKIRSTGDEMWNQGKYDYYWPKYHEAMDRLQKFYKERDEHKERARQEEEKRRDIEESTCPKCGKYDEWEEDTKMFSRIKDSKIDTCGRGYKCKNCGYLRHKITSGESWEEIMRKSDISNLPAYLRNIK